MPRIDDIFSNLRGEGRKALMPFVTAGYPSLEHTEAMLPAIEAAGASIVELGIPFSDPIADGPVIQASMTAALGAGFHTADAFAMVRRVRERLSLGLVVMVSYSIVYRMGVERFVGEAREAGVDGFILPDLPLDESDAARKIIADAGLTCSLLIAPTTPPDRAAAIARACTGFVYVVARTGITGERDELPPGLADRLTALRNVTELPIAVGFGIARPDHVAAVTQVADAAIVGSALVRQINDHADEPPDALAEHVGAFVADLARGLR